MGFDVFYVDGGMDALLYARLPKGKPKRGIERRSSRQVLDAHYGSIDDENFTDQLLPFRDHKADVAYEKI